MRGLLLFACLLSVACAGPPPPFELEAVAPVSSTAAPLRAGVATTTFTPDPAQKYPLGGHGTDARRVEWPLLFGAGLWGVLSLDAHQAWHEEGDAPADFLTPAVGVHDELTARALVLEAGAERIALVRFDGVVGSQRLHARVCELVADLGYAPAGVIVAATHTHAGVGCYLRSRFARLAALDTYRPEIFERLARACAEAIRAAHAARRPAAVGWGRAFDRGPDGAPRVAVNRRAEDFPDAIAPSDVDPEIGLLKVVDLQTRAPLACLVNFAVHPDVLGSQNLQFSADLAGALEREVSRRLPGRPPVLFFNGAEGEANPRGMPRGGSCGWRHVERLAAAFADAAAPALERLPATETRVRLRAARGWQAFGEPFLFFAWGDRRAFLEADEALWQRVLAAPLSLPLNALIWLGFGVTNARVAFNWNGSGGLRFGLGALTDFTRFPFHALSLEAGGRRALFATVPGEALRAVGEAIKDRARARGADQPFVLGLANGAMMYLADEAEYYRGGYEAMVTLFGPQTAARAVAAADACLAAVTPGAGVASR